MKTNIDFYIEKVLSGEVLFIFDEHSHESVFVASGNSPKLSRLALIWAGTVGPLYMPFQAKESKGLFGSAYGYEKVKEISRHLAEFKIDRDFIPLLLTKYNKPKSLPEATDSLFRLAGHPPIMGFTINSNVTQFVQEQNITAISMQSIANLCAEKSDLEYKGKAFLPTRFGNFNVYAYEEASTNSTHLALVYGSLKEEMLVRIHSECLTGDVFSSQRCDCQAQLHKAMSIITENQSGIILYMRQEGRGIGLANKILAYGLQDQGLDTIDANLQLGFKADQRDYKACAQMLLHLGVRKVRLLTNNPRKIEGLMTNEIKVIERVPVRTARNEYNSKYLQTKFEKMGHMLSQLNIAASGLD